jgi:hypothetical protein
MATLSSSTVELVGFRELRGTLSRNPPFGAKEWAAGLQELGQLGARLARQAAPRGATGQLAARIVTKIQAAALPQWVVVKDTARGQPRAYKRQNKKARAGLAPLRMTKGYAYPARLNYQAVYKGGKANRHFGWFTHAMDATRQGTGSILAKAAAEMERQWPG